MLLALLLSAGSPLEEHGQHALAPKAAQATMLMAHHSSCDRTCSCDAIPDLYAGEYWRNYNLGDMVQLYNTTEYFTRLRLDQRGSIVEDYMHRTRWINDMFVLAQIVQERAQGSATSFSSACAIHVRAGDVIECDIATVPEMLDHQVRSRAGNFSNCSEYPLFPNMEYVRPLSYFNSALLRANMSVQHCPDLLLVAGSNIDLRPFTKSNEYLSRLRDHLCGLGYRVEMQCGASPDDDLVTMSTTRAFLSSGGGFSRVVNNVRDKLRLNASAQ